MATFFRDIFIILVTFTGITSFSVAVDRDAHDGLGESVDSYVCLNCHDGSIAEHPMNHPFNVNYLEAQVSRPGAALRPIMDLTSSIILVENRVVCISCHDMESNLPSKLRLTLKQSVLCIACHDL